MVVEFWYRGTVRDDSLSSGCSFFMTGSSGRKSSVTGTWGTAMGVPRIDGSGTEAEEETVELVAEVSDFLFRWKREVERRDRGMRLDWLLGEVSIRRER